MAKSKLIVKAHIIGREDQAVEVWYGGEMIATVYGADGPGIRILTKYPFDIVRGGLGSAINLAEVRIEPS